MHVDMLFGADGRYDRQTGFFHLTITKGVGFPARIPHLTVFAEIDIEPAEITPTAQIYVRMLDPEGVEVAHSEMKQQEVGINSFDGHGVVALMTAVPPSFPTRGVYVAELMFNGRCIHRKGFQVGE